MNHANPCQRRSHVRQLLGNQNHLPEYRDIARRLGCSPATILSDIKYIISTRSGCTIYGLVDPVSRAVRYVGQTDGDPEYRLTRHISRVKHGRENNKAKAAWILSLLDAGNQPHLVILERCTSAAINEREQWWIKHHLDQGVDLVNAAARQNGRKGGRPRKTALTATE